MKRFSCSAIVVVALAVLFGSTLAFSAEEVRIGYIVPLTGAVARDGELSLSGAKVAVGQINGAGGVLGRQLKLYIEDHKAVPAEGVNAAIKLTDRDKVHVIAQDSVSSVCSAIGENIRKMEKPVPFITGVCTSPRLTKVDNTWFFRACQNALMEGPAFVKHWVENLKIKTISFLGTNDEWGKTTVETYAKIFKEMGGEVLSTDYFLVTETDFSAHLTKIKRIKPDALEVIARTENGARISLQFADLGLDKVMKQLGCDGQTTDDYIKLAGKASEGIWVMSRYEPTLPGAKNERFIKDYKALTNQLPDAYAQSGYDNIYIIAEAIKRAGTTDANKLREALEKTDYQGVASRITFDKNRQAHPDLLISQVRNGVRQVATKVSTADIDFAK
jgi:branched-chain amino acid transport system substrate-binding protein